MQLTVSNGGPPPGSYAAKFAGVDQTTHDEYGAGLRWRFEVLQGDHAGKTASRITGLSPTPKNGAGRMLAGLLGRQIENGQSVNLADFVGKEFLVVVGATENGTRVEAVVPKT